MPSGISRLSWADYKKERLNPANGLCLAKTQDAAFDQHLITLDDDYRLVVSQRIKDFYDRQTIQENFASFEGQPITLPERFRRGRSFKKGIGENFQRIRRSTSSEGAKILLSPQRTPSSAERFRKGENPETLA